MAEHSTVSISNGGKCESHSDIRWVRHKPGQKRKWAASSNCDCARMIVDQMVELSHMNPTRPPKTTFRLTTKTNSEDGTESFPSHSQSSVPSSPSFEIATKKNSVAKRLRISFTAIIKNYAPGFSAKNVRTLFRNPHKIARRL